jgi:hypothetical protein
LRAATLTFVAASTVAHDLLLAYAMPLTKLQPPVQGAGRVDLPKLIEADAVICH